MRSSGRMLQSEMGQDVIHGAFDASFAVMHSVAATKAANAAHASSRYFKGLSCISATSGRLIHRRGATGQERLSKGSAKRATDIPPPLGKGAH